MISDPSSEYGPDPESPESSADFADLDKAQAAWKSAQRFTRENPLPVILLAFVLGALFGALVSRGKRKQKDAVQAAKELLEAAYEQLAEILPQISPIKFGK